MDELSLSYETIYLNFSTQEQKAEEHTKYNPNGRIPTLIDHHNNDFVIWWENSDVIAPEYWAKLGVMQGVKRYLVVLGRQVW